MEYISCPHCGVTQIVFEPPMSTSDRISVDHINSAHYRCQNCIKIIYINIRYSLAGKPSFDVLPLEQYSDEQLNHHSSQIK